MPSKANSITPEEALYMIAVLVTETAPRIAIKESIPLKTLLEEIYSGIDKIPMIRG